MNIRVEILNKYSCSDLNDILRRAGSSLLCNLLNIYSYTCVLCKYPEFSQFPCGFSSHDIPVRRNTNQIMANTVIISFPERRLDSWVDAFHCKTATKVPACVGGADVTTFFGFLFPLSSNVAEWYKSHLCAVKVSVLSFWKSGWLVCVTCSCVKMIKTCKLAYKKLSHSGGRHLMLNFIMFFTDFIQK